MKSLQNLQCAYVNALAISWVDRLVNGRAFVLEYLFTVTAAVFRIPFFVVSADLWSGVTLAGTSFVVPALSC